MAKKKDDGVVEAEALNIDDLLRRGTKNRLIRIGIELEGGWLEQPQGVKFERDGSVFKAAGDDGRYGRRDHPGYFFGEVNSGIIQPAGKDMFLRKYYPQLFDNSCGLHVHYSFRTVGQYQTLTDPAYQETLLKYMGRWAEEERLPAKHPIWERLEGKSLYCQKKWWPDLQIANDKKDYDQKRPGHRYTIINACWRGGKQRTIECRLLPMLDGWQLASRAVQRVLDITNASLLLLYNRKLCRETGKVIFRKDDVYSEEIVDVL